MTDHEINAICQRAYESLRSDDLEWTERRLAEGVLDLVSEVTTLEAELERTERERDALRAEVDRLRDEVRCGR